MTTRMIIENLVEQYLNDENHQFGIINGDWIAKIQEELHLRDLSDLQLADMWDMVSLTIGHIVDYYHINSLSTGLSDEKRAEMAMKMRLYMDAKSAFVEVVNHEARRRKN